MPAYVADDPLDCVAIGAGRALEHLSVFRDSLTPQQIHDLYRLRIAVFIMEQDCPFQDVDGADPKCWHLLGRDAAGELVAYCRLVPAGVKFTEPSIGRVITAQSVRRTGMGRVLMAEAMKRARELWPGQALRIGAQAHL